MRLFNKMRIVKKYQRTPPVRVIAIAKDFGIGVYKMGGAEWQEKDISGLIRKDPSIDRFEIVVNANHDYPRQRFTVAHEIAHFLLHEEKIGDGITDDVLYRSGLDTEMETEANVMAANILMPRHLVDEEIIDGTYDIVKLAKKFVVPPSAISILLGVPYEGNSSCANRQGSNGYPIETARES